MSNNVTSMYAILNRLSDKSLQAIAMWTSAWNWNNPHIPELLTKDSNER